MGRVKRPKTGWHHTKKTCLKISRSSIGKKMSIEACRKISISNIKRGAIPPSRKGIKLSKEHKDKISKALKGRIYTEDPCYRTVHQFVSKQRGTPDRCEKCKRRGFQGIQIHWASINHKYGRNPEGYIRLCVKCHANYDARKIKFGGKEMTRREWRKKLKLTKATLDSRLNRGWTLKKALVSKKYR
jgi:hypothetical protein